MHKMYSPLSLSLSLSLSVSLFKTISERVCERDYYKRYSVNKNGGCLSVSEFEIKASIAVYFRDPSQSLSVFDEQHASKRASVDSPPPRKHEYKSFLVQQRERERERERSLLTIK